MESKAARVYQDFKPSMELVPEDDLDTLLIYLPGFAKDQLRIQLRTRNLILSGERKLHENTWSRFRMEFPVSTNCDLNKISAKFEGNILFVRQPKMITPAAKPEEAIPAAVAAPQNPVDAKPTAAAASQKPVDAKPTAVAAPQKPVDESNAGQKPAPTIQTNIEKKEAGKDEDDRKRGVVEKVEKSEGKGCAEGVCEYASKKKTGESDKKMVYGELAETVIEKYKRVAGALAMKLKVSGYGVNTIAIVVVGIVVGIYVSNSLKSWTKA